MVMRQISMVAIFVLGCGAAPPPASHATQAPVIEQATQVVASPPVETAAPTPAPSPSSGPLVSDGEAVARWIAERARLAAVGRGELVRLPLVQKSDGWGCVCPDFYVGVDATYHSGGDTFVRPRFAEGVSMPAPRTHPAEGYPDERASDGVIALVDGYFTGERGRFVDGDTFYPWVFHVVRVGARISDDRASRTRVQVLGAEPSIAACRLVVHDDNPPLQVRSAHRVGADAVGTLANDSAVAPIEWNGSWVHIESPAGWVWAESLEPRCE
jgi:hypothetical protein